MGATGFNHFVLGYSIKENGEIGFMDPRNMRGGDANDPQNDTAQTVNKGGYKRRGDRAVHPQGVDGMNSSKLEESLSPDNLEFLKEVPGCDGDIQKALDVVLAYQRSLPERIDLADRDFIKVQRLNAELEITVENHRSTISNLEGELARKSHRLFSELQSKIMWRTFSIVFLLIGIIGWVRSFFIVPVRLRVHAEGFDRARDVIQGQQQRASQVY